MAYVYILKSKALEKFYIGSTENVQRRLAEHNLGKVRSTKPLKPLQVMLIQEYKTLSKARTIESKLKKLKRKDYIEKIIKDGFIKMRA